MSARDLPKGQTECEFGDAHSHSLERQDSIGNLDSFLERGTLGQRVADSVTEAVGSWVFLGINFTFFAIWCIANSAAPDAFDAYPFILMNVLLSAQAAYTAPVILMSQNRCLEKQRLRESDLHEKVDHVRINQIDAIFLELRTQRRHMMQILNKMKLGPEVNEDDEENSAMTDGEERFGKQRRTRKPVPAVVERRTCCFGWINLGRDERNFTFAERAADAVARGIGGWTFIIGQTIIVICWVIVNSLFDTWDPFPFILLNLGFSIQAAFTAPIILMSQNRQGYVDQIRNEDLHEKIDHVRLNRIMLVWEELKQQRDEMDKLLHHLDIKTKKSDMPSTEMFINGTVGQSTGTGPLSSTDSSETEADEKQVDEREQELGAGFDAVANGIKRTPRRSGGHLAAPARDQGTELAPYVVRWHMAEDDHDMA